MRNIADNSKRISLELEVKRVSLTRLTEINPVYHSLLDRKLRAEIFHFLSKWWPWWGITSYEQNLNVDINSQPSYARGRSRCRRLFTKEIQATCLFRASCSCYEVSSLSDRAAHVSRAHWPKDTTPRVPFLTACYRRAFIEQMCMYVCMYVRAAFIGTNNKL